MTVGRSGRDEGGRDVVLGVFEEQVLLAAVRVGERAYGMSVRREIRSTAGRSVSIGAVYATLDRLESKGLVASFRGEGGGRRIFRLTPAGAHALVASRSMRERLWDGVADVVHALMSSQ